MHHISDLFINQSASFSQLQIKVFHIILSQISFAAADYLFGVSGLYLWALQLHLQAVWGRDRQDSHSTSSSTNCLRQGQVRSFTLARLRVETLMSPFSAQQHFSLSKKPAGLPSYKERMQSFC